MKVNAMSDQLDMIKVRAESITELIDTVNLSDKNECIDLIQSINSEIEVMQIHIEFANELIN